MNLHAKAPKRAALPLDRRDIATVRDATTGTRTESGLAGLEIVHIVRQYAPRIGGLESFVAKLAAEQRKTYRRVRVVTCDRIFTDPETLLPATETIDGIEVRRLPYLGSDRYPIMRGLLKAIASADIVHVHAVDFAFDMMALTKPLHRKTLVATTHGGFFHTSAYSTLKKIWFQTLTRTSARMYDGLVCCSESDLAQFRPIAGDRAQLVMNGVDVEKFAGASASQLTRNMVTLGRFSTNKRLDRLIDVVASLTADDPLWHLDICGVPSGVSVDDLDRLIAARGLGGTIDIHVGLPTEGLRDVIGRSSFFVSASEYEGFGLALVEAMSAGLLPVVNRNSAFEALAASHPGVTTCDFAHPGDVAERLRGLHLAATENLAALRQEAMGAVRGFAWGRVKAEYDRIYAAAHKPGR